MPEIIKGQWNGYPVEIVGQWLSSRHCYEVVFWLNPPWLGGGIPTGHRTLRNVTPATWEAIKCEWGAGEGRPIANRSNQMTLNEAIGKRLAEMRKAEEERQRQEEAEERRQRVESERAIVWLCGYLLEKEGVLVHPEEFHGVCVEQSGAVRVNYAFRGGNVALIHGISKVYGTDQFTIATTMDGHVWRAAHGGPPVAKPTFVDACIHAGRLNVNQ